MDPVHAILGVRAPAGKKHARRARGQGSGGWEEERSGAWSGGPEQGRGSRDRGDEGWVGEGRCAAPGPNERQEVSRRKGSRHRFSGDASSLTCRSRRPAPCAAPGHGLTQTLQHSCDSRVPSVFLCREISGVCRARLRIAIAALRAMTESRLMPPDQVRSNRRNLEKFSSICAALGFDRYFGAGLCGVPRGAPAGQGAGPSRPRADIADHDHLGFRRGTGHGSMVHARPSMYPIIGFSSSLAAARRAAGSGVTAC
jgi:hypothetical protein